MSFGVASDLDNEGYSHIQGIVEQLIDIGRGVVRGRISIAEQPFCSEFDVHIDEADFRNKIPADLLRQMQICKDKIATLANLARVTTERHFVETLSVYQFGDFEESDKADLRSNAIRSIQEYAVLMHLSNQGFLNEILD